IGSPPWRKARFCLVARGTSRCRGIGCGAAAASCLTESASKLPHSKGTVARWLLSLLRELQAAGPQDSRRGRIVRYGAAGELALYLHHRAARTGERLLGLREHPGALRRGLQHDEPVAAADAERGLPAPLRELAVHRVMDIARLEAGVLHRV